MYWLIFLSLSSFTYDLLDTCYNNCLTHQLAMESKLLPFFSLAIATLVLQIQCRTILDLEADVRASTAYKDIPLLCAKCSLAGADNTGCWGYSEQSAVKVSGCTDGTTSCFCDDTKLNSTAAYILNLAEEICLEAGTPSSASESLAVWAYEEFCSIRDPTSSTHVPTSTSTDPVPQPTDPVEPLHPIEKFGIIFGAIMALLMLILGLVQLLYMIKGGGGFWLWLCISGRKQIVKNVVIGTEPTDPSNENERRETNS